MKNRASPMTVRATEPTRRRGTRGEGGSHIGRSARRETEEHGGHRDDRELTGLDPEIEADESGDSGLRGEERLLEEACEAQAVHEAEEE